MMKHDPSAIWWGFITIGAVSNVLDRLTLGGVLDYIDLSYFPIFNLSDVYITIGVMLLLYKELLQKKKFATR